MAVVETPGDPAATVPTPLVGLAVAAMGLVFATLLFVPARRLDWTLGWIYVGIVVLTLAINLACLLRWNPELIRRRVGFRRGTKTWDVVWLALFTALEGLTPADLDQEVLIRGQPHSVSLAISRSLAHTAYHVGQIVLTARVLAGDNWQTLTIPRGESADYNRRVWDRGHYGQ